MQIDELNQERMLRENGLAFFGAITASVSHELNNVISIIDQSTGLLEDLLYGSREGDSIPNERLQRIADRVSTQAQRGIRIIKRLNSFAHSVDDPVCEFEMNSLVENLVRLCQRFADLKNVHLEASLSDEQINITSSPFLLQQVLHIYIKRILAFSNPEETITISTAVDDSFGILTIECEPSSYSEDHDSEYFNLLINRLGGSTEIASNSNRILTKFSIPLKE